MTSSDIDPLRYGLAAGDENAYAELCERFGARLYRTAAGLLGNRHDAEDVVQDVFASVVRSRKQLISVNDLAAYLFAALRNAVGRLAEKHSRTRQALQTVADDQQQASQSRADCRDDERFERLRRALESLPPDQREMVVMKMNSELTFAQIARVLDISPNTAASRYRYGLEKLRALLDEHRP